MDVVNHEVERSLARCDFVFAHEDEVCSSTQFKDRDFWPQEEGAHSDGLHKCSRFFHAVCLQNDVCDCYQWAFVTGTHFLGAQRWLSG